MPGSYAMQQTTNDESPLNVNMTETSTSSSPAHSIVSSSSSSSLAPVHRVSMISYHDLGYTIQVPGACCSRRQDKQILHGISGLFLPGMNAIMGPTGCGKTTLLDVLSARVSQTGVTGRILIDGRRPPENLRFITGYVAQDDLVMGTLTVRENITFSANLRLSNDISLEEKRMIVDNAISELGLCLCADQMIGSYFARGVSGGERKRTSIGMELVISPTVLFLDEPTTGLDASTAYSVMSLLHGLSRKGQMIVFSIHQPRYTIFSLFDRLTLLARGRTIFHGHASNAVEYFDSIGYKCETFNNPSDFFTDVINGDYSTADKSDAAETTFSDEIIDTGMGKKYEDESVDNEDLEDTKKTLTHDDKVALVENLASEFLHSAWYDRVTELLQPIVAEYKHRQTDKIVDSNDTAGTRRYAVPFLTQVKYLSQRTVINVFRDPYTLLSKFANSLIFAIVLGIMYYQMDYSYPAGLQNRAGALFFIVLTELIANASSKTTFYVERNYFIHETANGFYSVSSYYVAKVLIEIFSKRTLPLIIYATITYFMIGLQNTFYHYVIHIVILYLTTLASAAIITTLAASFDSPASIATVEGVFYFLTLQYGGLFVNIDTIPWPIQWIKWFSIQRYGYNAALINELKGETFYSNNINETVLTSVTGETYLAWENIPSTTDWDLWQNMLALGVFAIGFFIIGYAVLRRQTTLK